jgi:DNA polymerase-1
MAEESQEELNKLFASLEFKTWIKSSRSSGSEDPEAPKSKKEYQAVLTEKDLKEWAKKIDKCNVFAIDTETSSFGHNDRRSYRDIIGMQLKEKGCYIPIKHEYEEMPKQIPLTQIQKILGSAITKNQKKLVGQNLKFDLPMLNRHGIKVEEFLGDTMLMSYVLNSTGTRHGLDRMALYYLNYEPMKYEEVAGSASKQINFAQVEVPAATFYAAEDADVTLRLFNHLNGMLQRSAKVDQPA